jgi:hypothetical protein
MNLLGFELSIDTGFVGIIILIIVTCFGSVAIWMTLNSQFPKVRIDVRDRGLRQPKNYRILFNAIFKDDLIGMMMGRFVYMGDLSKLTYYTLPSGKRIYDAYMRYDYLFGFSDVTKSSLETKPVIHLDVKIGKGVLTRRIDGILDVNQGLLCPLVLEPTNHHITEIEVQNGKTIGSNYIQTMRRAQDVVEKNNPVMAVLISSIPLFIMGAMFAIMLYVAYLALGASAEKIFTAAMVCKGG